MFWTVARHAIMHGTRTEHEPAAEQIKITMDNPFGWHHPLT